MRAGPNHFRTAWIAAFTVAILSSQTTDFASTRAAAQTLLRRSKVAEAIPLLERARAADPAHYENSWDLALAYRQTNRLARARTLIQSMLAGGNNNKGELHNLLAEVEEASGNTLAAAAAYQEAAHLDPREKHIADWANHLMRYRAYDSAVKVFSSGAAMHPKSVVLRVGLGAAYYSTGDYDSAARELCAAADLDPADLRPLDFLGQSIDVAPAWNAAITQRLERYAARFPRHPRARLYYGLSLLKLPEPQLPAAERELRAAIAIDPRLSAAHLNLGILAEQRGEERQAIASLERAAAVDPDLETAHYRLSRLYRKTAQPALAARHLAAYERLKAKPKPAAAARPALRVE